MRRRRLRRLQSGREISDGEVIFVGADYIVFEVEGVTERIVTEIRRLRRTAAFPADPGEYSGGGFLAARASRRFGRTKVVVVQIAVVDGKAAK